ncbi:MAG: META and DUF4377 domain-containing protein [Burkholderiales bacterium]|nr:META and DUF4377 domain-containing protein [Burkholderiales bacterium]
MPEASIYFVALLLALILAAACTSESRHSAGSNRLSDSADDAAPRRSWPATLARYQWALESATDARNRPIARLFPDGGRGFVFEFSASRISVGAGCNQLIGSYSIADGSRIDIGGLASTMRACEPALMAADDAMSNLLARSWRLELEHSAQPRLRLVSAAKEALVLVGQATPEAGYGPATLMFLEVAAQKRSCVNPWTGDKACLYVRELHYNKDGLVETRGPWRLLYENIAGFTHTEGERSVLRLKRFERDPAPKGVPSTVYVLDLKVQSETVMR